MPESKQGGSRGARGPAGQEGELESLHPRELKPVRRGELRVKDGEVDKGVGRVNKIYEEGCDSM